jgi:hypothetical protein
MTRVMAASVSAGQAGQAGQAEQAVRAGQAVTARQAVTAGQAVTAVQALQAALAAEDAAIFGYGVAGAHLSGSRKSAAEQHWTEHNEARDTLTAMVSALGATPAAAQAFYRLPFEVTDPASAAKLAAYLEGGVTRAYLGLVAVSDRRLRTFGALAMQPPAERAAFWRGTTEAFPGLDASG